MESGECTVQGRLRGTHFERRENGMTGGGERRGERRVYKRVGERRERKNFVDREGESVLSR